MWLSLLVRFLASNCCSLVAALTNTIYDYTAIVCLIPLLIAIVGVWFNYSNLKRNVLTLLIKE